MAEWFKAAVLKIAFRVTGTGVRIPLPPPFSKWGQTSTDFQYKRVLIHSASFFNPGL